MMEMEVRHWMSNHEAEIGGGAFGASDIPAAGLDVAAKPAGGAAMCAAQSRAAYVRSGSKAAPHPAGPCLLTPAADMPLHLLCARSAN